MRTNKNTRIIKFGIPIVALAIAVITSFAFKSNVKYNTYNGKTANDKVYEFRGNATIKNQVQDPALWHLNPSGSACSSIDDPRACTILVDAAHALDSTLSGSNIVITANNDKGDGTTFRVTEAKDGVYSATPSNQLQ